MLALSSGAMVALAGCGGTADDTPTSVDETATATPGSDGEETESSTSTEEPLGQAVDPILNVMGEQVPTDVNMHPFGGERNFFWRLLKAPHGSSVTAAQSRDDVTYMPHLLLESYIEDDNKTFVQKYDTDFTWHNGEKVTAEDRWMAMKINQLSSEMRDAQVTFEDLEIVDESTLKHTYAKKTRPLIGLGQNGMRVPRWPRWQLEPKLEEVRDATTVNELDAIDKKYAEMTTPLEDAVGHSMFQIESVSSDQAVLTKYEDHPYADQQNVESIHYTLVGGDSARRQEIQNGNIDHFGGIPPNTTLPDTHEKLSRRNPGMNKYDFNWHGPCSNMHLRRAINYAMSSEDIVQNAGSYFPINTWTGMTPEANTRFLRDGFADELIDYGSGSEESAAEAEMGKAGYEKEDNAWVDGDGEPLELTVMSINWFENPQQTAVSQLRSFGIEVDNQTVGYAAWDAARRDPENGDWDMMQYFHGMGYDHPARYFEHDWMGGYVVLNRFTGEWGYANKPRMVEIPEEVGATDLSGSTKSLNIWSYMQTITNPDTVDEEVARLNHDFCQWMNFSAAIVPIFQQEENLHYNQENFVSEGFDDQSVLNDWDRGTFVGVERS